MSYTQSTCIRVISAPGPIWNNSRYLVKYALIYVITTSICRNVLNIDLLSHLLLDTSILNYNMNKNVIHINRNVSVFDVQSSLTFSNIGDKSGTHWLVILII